MNENMFDKFNNEYLTKVWEEHCDYNNKCKKMIESARSEYVNETLDTGYIPSSAAFYYWLQNRYGIRYETNMAVRWDNIQIIDQEKYLLFLLKWG